MVSVKYASLFVDIIFFHETEAQFLEKSVYLCLYNLFCEALRNLELWLDILWQGLVIDGVVELGAEKHVDFIFDFLLHLGIEDVVFGQIERFASD
jgi:hypothetical protein